MKQQNPNGEVIKNNPIWAMVMKNIDHNISRKLPIESITLSRFKYDSLEKWLDSIGFYEQMERQYGKINGTEPLTYRNIEIMRSNTSSSQDIVVNYRKTLNDKQVMTNLDMNIEQLNIKNADVIDTAFKNTKRR